MTKLFLPNFESLRLGDFALKSLDSVFALNFPVLLFTQ